MTRIIIHIRRSLAVLFIGVLFTLSTSANAQADTSQLRWNAFLGYEDGEMLHVYGSYNSGCVSPWKKGSVRNLLFMGNEYVDTIEFFDDTSCRSKVFQAGVGEWDVGKRNVLSYQVY